MDKHVAILGAGCVGLGSAWHLHQMAPNTKITVIADKFESDTTSAGAGGFWLPHVLGNTPEDKQRTWSMSSFDHFMSLAHGPAAGETGSHLISGFQFCDRELSESPWWSSVVLGYRRCTRRELQLLGGGRCKDGMFYTTVKVDSRKYLRWMMNRLKERGITFEKRHLNSLTELPERCDLVINCCGLGSAQLFSDEKVKPARGQIAHIHCPWTKHFMIFKEDDISTTYCLPGPDHVVVGGTQQDGDWNLEICEKDKKRILDDLILKVPSYKGSVCVGDWVGLRPVRDSVRLETERLCLRQRELTVVHNYGHGGSGFTLHWGCGEEAARLAVGCMHRAKL